MWARGHRRCRYNPESRPASPKRPRRSQSSEAAEPLEALTSKLSNQMGALEVVLDELRAPGGAFLPVATDHMEPTASQRAWLTWQLTHAGAALHWALTVLDSLLPRTTDLRARRSTRPGRLGLRGAPRLSPPLLWSCKAPRQHLSTLRRRTSSTKHRNPPEGQCSSGTRPHRPLHPSSGRCVPVSRSQPARMCIQRTMLV